MTTFQGQRTITITLPLPDRCLHPNRIGGANGFAVSRARRASRAIACHETANAWHGQPLVLQPGQAAPMWSPLPVWTRVRATVTFRGVRRDQDSDNAYGWLKSVRDGIADALCGGQDHEWEWVGEPMYEKGKPGVTITITEGAN